VALRPRSPVLLFFLAGLTVSLGWTAAKSLRRIEKAFLYAGESALDERSREFGRPYALAIEAIRRTIPRHDAYALIDGDPEELGGALWVRFDLEPRRAVFLGLRKDLPKTANELRRRLPPDIRWAVIGYANAPPVLVDLRQLPAEAKAP
jgi:hypothetical protein